VDSKDHVWVLTRSRATPDNVTEKERRMVREGRAHRTPKVSEVDKSGEVVNSWNLSGTPPDNLHGIFVDYQGYVWIGGNGGNDSIVQKYDRNGTLQRQIGVQHMRDTTNHSPTLLNRPSDIFVDPANGEVYISDGYGNRRVIVFGAGNANNTAPRMAGEQGLKCTIRRGDDHPTAEFGRAGHQAGESTFLHTIAADSNGDLYAAETIGGRRLQKFKATGEQK